MCIGPMGWMLIGAWGGLILVILFLLVVGFVYSKRF